MCRAWAGVERRTCQADRHRRTVHAGTKLTFEVAADTSKIDIIAAYAGGVAPVRSRSRSTNATIAAAIARSPIACAPPVTCQTTGYIPTQRPATQNAPQTRE